MKKIYFNGFELIINLFTNFCKIIKHTSAGKTPSSIYSRTILTWNDFQMNVVLFWNGKEKYEMRWNSRYFLWMEMELSIQKVSIPKNAFQLSP